MVASDLKSLYLFCINSKILMFKKENDPYYTIQISTLGQKHRANFTISGEKFYQININKRIHLVAGINNNNDNEQDMPNKMDDVSDLS